MPNFDYEFFSLFLNLRVLNKKINSGKFAYIWHFQQFEITAKKFENSRGPRFKNEVFVAVAVARDKAPTDDQMAFKLNFYNALSKEHQQHTPRWKFLKH